MKITIKRLDDDQIYHFNVKDPIELTKGEVKKICEKMKTEAIWVAGNLYQKTNYEK